ncbi:transglycosylase SLT domain-containing protein [Jongsikchunia kroppenstedtii]|uniref:transglycosylase SLT domain-containing protein n=1 Tax=Jongsikchunia kroppenstedtii TaxID=1121721 RepID=UPI00039FA21E|nr:transglycosylase SLT domain-containing protein [Jongsikchunia kroppenstedtii]
MSVVSKHAIMGRFTPRTRAFGTLGLSAVAIAGLVTAGAGTMNDQAHATVTPARSVQAPSNIGVSAASPAAPAAAPVVTPTIAPAAVTAPAPAPAAPKYTNDLDGWIREALDIMKKNGIPGSYDGIYRNVMRESTGNPQAINLYDSNAAAGNPSKGLLQVIQTTFAVYHVPGTSFDIYDPVANIAAACNYAAHNYGSMDNVNSAY